MNSHDYYFPCSKETLNRLYHQEVKTLREVAAVLRVSTGRICTAMRRYGIKARPNIQRKMHGPDNNNWKGDKAGNDALHKRLYAGQKEECEVCGTKDKARTYDWANLTGKYHDPKDYKRMCRKCHRLYDFTRKRAEKEKVA